MTNNELKRELTRDESLVETNSDGVELHRPKYGFRWTIQQLTRVHYIGSERQVRAMWKAHYQPKLTVHEAVDLYW